MKLVQYIVLRKDLGKSKSIVSISTVFIIIYSKEWSKGANIAQACHVVTKCLITFQNDDFVKQYTSNENINEMTKIILAVI